MADKATAGGKATVSEFADAVRQEYPGKFDGISDDELIHAVVQEKPDLAEQVDLRTYKPTAVLRPKKESPSMLREAMSINPVSVGIGGTKRAIKTAYDVYKGVANVAQNQPADTVRDPAFERDLESSDAGQKLGAFGEQGVEFAAGDTLAGAGTKAILGSAASKAPRLLQAAGRIARSGAVGATVAEAEKADPTVGAIVGAGGGAVGEVADAVAPTVRRLSGKLVDSARQSVARTLGATKETMKHMANKVVAGYEAPIEAAASAGKDVPGLIDRKISAWTRKGLSAKAASEVEDLGGQIDALWSELPEDATVQAAPIKEAIKEARDKFVQKGPLKTITETKPLTEIGPDEKIVGTPDYKTGTAQVERQAAETAVIEPAAVRNLSRMERMVDALTDDAGEVNVHHLRKVKQVFDDVVAGKGGYAGKQLSLADHAGVLARREAANGIRDELAKQFPDIAVINREFHFWSQVQDVIDETLKRTSSQSQPMGQQLGKVAGAAAAGKLGVVKAVMTGEVTAQLRKLTTSAGWNTKISAPMKMKLAGLLAGGNPRAAVDFMHKLAFSAGVQLTRDKQQPDGDQEAEP